MRQRSRKHQLQKRIQRRRPKLRLKRYRQGSVGAQRESSETSKEGTVELWRLRPTRMKRIIMRKQEEGQEVNDAADVMETVENTEAEASFGSWTLLRSDFEEVTLRSSTKRVLKDKMLFFKV